MYDPHVSAEMPHPHNPEVSPVSRERPVDGRRTGLHRAATQATRMAMVMTDPNRPDNPIIWVNKAFLEMTGYDAEEVIGVNCRFLQGPDTNLNTVREIAKAIRDRTETNVEILNYRKSGETFWNALYLLPVYDEDHKVAYFFASQLNVSQRRITEERLLKSQRMEAIGQLTAGIAHDFNNLLAVVIGKLDTLLMRETDPDKRNLVEGAITAADRGATLVKQLMAFSRQQTLDARPTNLNTLVGNLERLIRGTVLGPSVEVSLQPMEPLPSAIVDATQAQGAILNILLNARDAMPGGGQIVIRTTTVTLPDEAPGRYGELQPGEYVELSVKDNGEGMSPETLQRATEPFFTTKGPGRGSGMGLSQVHGFMEQSRGLMNIQSEPGHGTCIRLLFPAVREAAKPEVLDLSPPTRSPVPEHRKIMVVDDEPGILEFVQRTLLDFDYQVIRAENATQALDILDGPTKVDLLLTDYLMPGLNGLELAASARELRPRLKIIVTTGYAEPEAHVLDHTFPVLIKPFRVRELIEAVRTALADKEA